MHCTTYPSILILESFCKNILQCDFPYGNNSNRKIPVSLVNKIYTNRVSINYFSIIIYNRA